MGTLKPKVERNLRHLLLGKKTAPGKGAKEIMTTEYSKLCPFCEGFIDFYSQDCPYCGSQMEKNELNEKFNPIYTTKNEEPIVVLQPNKGEASSFYPIVIGGVLAPLAFFLWLVGGAKGVDITIKTNGMPWIFLASSVLLVYGLLKKEKSGT